MVKNSLYYAGVNSFSLRIYDPPYVNAPVFDSQGVALEGLNYMAELWGSATPDSLTPVLTFASRQRVFVPFDSGGGAGYFSDPEGRSFGDQLTVLGVPPSTGLAWLEVRAWDSRLGATYEEVAARSQGVLVNRRCFPPMAATRLPYWAFPPH